MSYFWKEEPQPDTPYEIVSFGEGKFDQTAELIAWVRMMFSEHHSNLADITHPQTIEHIVRLVLLGMCTIGRLTEENDDDDPNLGIPESPI